jgi:hypothetical protein
MSFPEIVDDKRAQYKPSTLLRNLSKLPPKFLERERAITRISSPSFINLEKETEEEGKEVFLGRITEWIYKRNKKTAKLLFPLNLLTR